MFTGIIEEMGTLLSREDFQQGVAQLQRIRIGCDTVLDGTKLGDSIAVNGVCLTVVEVDEHSFSADVMEETLRLTSLGGLPVGASVNVERALAVGDRLGGHIVQGHVDTTGEVVFLSPRHVLRVKLDSETARFMAYKGSVTLNGVSLTVSAVGEEWVEVSLIPETLTRTTLGDVQAGDVVNIEVDAIAKYLDHLARPYRPTPSS